MFYTYFLATFWSATVSHNVEDMSEKIKVDASIEISVDIARYIYRDVQIEMIFLMPQLLQQKQHSY